MTPPPPNAERWLRVKAITADALGLTLTRMGRWREARGAFEGGLKAAAGLDSTPPEPDDVSLVDDLRQNLVRCNAALAMADR